MTVFEYQTFTFAEVRVGWVPCPQTAALPEHHQPTPAHW